MIYILISLIQTFDDVELKNKIFECFHKFFFLNFILFIFKVEFLCYSFKNFKMRIQKHIYIKNAIKTQIASSFCFSLYI